VYGFDKYDFLILNSNIFNVSLTLICTGIPTKNILIHRNVFCKHKCYTNHHMICLNYVISIKVCHYRFVTYKLLFVYNILYKYYSLCHSNFYCIYTLSIKNMYMFINYNLTVAKTIIYY